MIAEDCKRLRDQLNEVARAKEREHIVSQLDSRCKELVELRDMVVSVTQALSALTKRTDIIGTVDGSKAHNSAAKIRKALAEDPLSITKGRELTNMKAAFAKLSQQAIEATTATWFQYKPKAKPSVDANQLAQAEQQEAFRVAAGQLRAAAKAADEMSRKAPATDEDFSNLEALWERIRELIGSLPAVANDPKVKEFLKAANSPNGASLELLTSEVRQWLQENKTADKYRVFSA